MLVHLRATPSIKFAGTHLYTGVERDTVRVKFLAQEHDTRSPDRVPTPIARSGDERTIIRPPRLRLMSSKEGVSFSNLS